MKTAHHISGICFSQTFNCASYVLPVMGAVHQFGQPEGCFYDHAVQNIDADVEDNDGTDDGSSDDCFHLSPLSSDSSLVMTPQGAVADADCMIACTHRNKHW